MKNYWGLPFFFISLPFPSFLCFSLTLSSFSLPSPFLLSADLSYSSIPTLGSKTLETQLFWVSAVNSHSGAWGGVTAEVEFGSF